MVTIVNVDTVGAVVDAAAVDVALAVVVTPVPVCGVVAVGVAGVVVEVEDRPVSVLGGPVLLVAPLEVPELGPELDEGGGTGGGPPNPVGVVGAVPVLVVVPEVVVVFVRARAAASDRESSPVTLPCLTVIVSSHGGPTWHPLWCGRWPIGSTRNAADPWLDPISWGEGPSEHGLRFR